MQGILGVIDVATLSVIRRWALREQMSIREIARRTGLSRTVKKYLRAGEEMPRYAKRESSSKLDPYAEKLATWLAIEATKSRKQRRNLRQIHTRFNVYKTSSGADIARFVNGATTTDIAAPTGSTSTELAGGFTLALSPSTSLYGELGKLWASGGNAKVKSSINGSLGVRVKW
jgi:transcriptional regulator with XRE-family HTH domain